MQQREKARDEAEAKVLKLEERYNALMQSAAETKARQDSLAGQIEQNQKRQAVIQERLDHNMGELKALQEADDGKQAFDDLAGSLEKVEVQIKDLQKQLEAAQQQQEDTIEAAEKADVDQRKATEMLSKHRSEIEMLEQFFEGQDDQDFETVLDQVQAHEGFEKALSRALGDTLMASLNESAPVYWQKREVADLMRRRNYRLLYPRSVWWLMERLGRHSLQSFSQGNLWCQKMGLIGGGTGCVLRPKRRIAMLCIWSKRINYRL